MPLRGRRHRRGRRLRARRSRAGRHVAAPGTGTRERLGQSPQRPPSERADPQYCRGPRDVSRDLRRAAPERHRRARLGARRLAPNDLEQRHRRVRYRPGARRRVRTARSDRDVDPPRRRFLERTVDGAHHVARRVASSPRRARRARAPSSGRHSSNQANGDPGRWHGTGRRTVEPRRTTRRRHVVQGVRRNLPDHHGARSGRRQSGTTHLRR